MSLVFRPKEFVNGSFACNVNFNLVMFSIIYFFKNYTTNAILYWMAVFNSVAFFH